MRMRTLGRTGLQVSVLGFGCGTVGGLMVRGDPVDQERAIARALEAGVNYFDTAVQYGDGASERNLGRILKSLKAENVIVGTKVRLPSAAQANAGIRASLEGSLQRLGRERVDIFYLHNPVTSAGGPDSLSTRVVLDEVVPAFDRLRQEGKIGFLGFTAIGFKVFQGNVLKKVRRNDRWSGYYFERMIDFPVPEGEPPNQLWGIVERIRNDQVRALNKFELSLFDPVRDVDNSPYGGQCLSFMSFKVVPGAQKTLTLTAMYRNHFYIEKLLGNLIGLGRLMSFVARETGLEVGALTVVSTHAEIDQPSGARRSDVTAMISRFDQAGAAPAA